MSSMEKGGGSFTVVDGIMVGLYFVVVLVTGIYAIATQNRSNVSGYFLGGRSMGWVTVGASLFASNIGSQHFIGLAGSGVVTGLAMGAFEFNAMFTLLLLGWIFAPVYIASCVCTLPEYIRKRFGGRRIQVYLSILSLFLYIFTKISVNLFAGSIIIQRALHWDLWASVLLLLTVTTIIACTGGLAAVIYTDTIQTFLMLIGGFILMGISYGEVGGMRGLYENYPKSVSPSYSASNGSTCGSPRHDAFNLLQSLDGDLPWLAYLLGATINSCWYWCCDQVIVQRTLSAKNLSHAKGGTLFAASIKIFPMFMMVIPGMIARVLYPEIACVSPSDCESYCGNSHGCSNLAYPMLVIQLMPDGLRGVLIAVMLCALMTDLCSIFNSASALFTMDLYPLIRRKATNRELMIAGRLFTAFMVFASVAWIPVIQNGSNGELYIYLQSITSYLVPPVAAVYTIAIAWPRCNELGAFVSLIVAFFIGLLRIVIDLAYESPPCGTIDNRPEFIKFHWLYFGFLLYMLVAFADHLYYTIAYFCTRVTIFIAVLVSLISSPGYAWLTIRTTYQTRFDDSTRPDEQSELLENDELNEMKAEVTARYRPTSTVTGIGIGSSSSNDLQSLQAFTDGEVQSNVEVVLDVRTLDGYNATRTGTPNGGAAAEPLEPAVHLKSAKEDVEDNAQKASTTPTDEEKRPLSRCSKLVNFICGISGVETDDASPYNTTAEVRLNTLDEDPITSRFLNIGLIGVFILCITLHLTFIWPWYRIDWDSSNATSST